MNHVFKLIFMTLMLTLALTFSYGQVTIELNLDSTTHVLSDPGTTEVYRTDKVAWQIKAGEDIQWFRIVGAGHPFHHLATGGYWIKWTGTVRGNAPYVDWKYRIIYKLKSNSTPQFLDPKIAVKPTPISPTPVIILLGLIVTTITSIVFFSLWRITAGKLAKQMAAAKPAMNNPQNR